MARPTLENIKNAVPYGTLEDGDGNFQKVRMMSPDLPTDSKKLDRCRECITQGMLSEVQNDFLLGGYDFRDGKKDLITQISCSGLGFVSRVSGRKCNLKMTQYNEEGSVLSEMKAEGQ